MAESAGPGDRLHDLLLAMTGRVDDDAINSTREMLGTAQLDTAAEFLVGCLLAGRIPVTSTEQYQLRRVLDETRSQHALADRLHVVESVPSAEHRFTEQYEPDRELADALDPVAERLTGVRALWCAWRATPAGVTYGAVPRRVLLAEVGSDGSVAAAGYQLLEALRRAGISCSVDVFASGTDLPDYHHDALAAARRVHLDKPMVASDFGSANRGRASRASSGGESAGGSDLPSEPPAPPPPAPELEREEIFEQRSEESFEAEYEQSFEAAVEELAAAAPESVRTDTAQDGEPEPSVAESEDKRDESNMRVPAAVDAKLTDRERNLLRKLHEELAQREHERSDDDQQAVSNYAGQRDSWSSMPGTGGFPSIGAASASNQQNRGRQ